MSVRGSKGAGMGEKWEDEEDEDQGGGVSFGPGGEADEASIFRRRVELFDVHSRDELAYPKIFSELGFTFVDDGCDGYCPECPNQRTCDAYPELKGDWEELLNPRN